MLTILGTLAANPSTASVAPGAAGGPEMGANAQYRSAGLGSEGRRTPR